MKAIMLRRIFLTWFALASSTFAFEVKMTGEGLLRDGKPFFIKGAGGRERLDELVQRGGNSVRTWGDRELPDVLEKAEKLGLAVCAGIWLEPECSWFSYRKPEHCQRQLDRVRAFVQKHRNHPSLLLWGLGNEAEGDGSNDAYWQQLNQLARMVHLEDPLHPTFTAVAGLSEPKARGLNAHAPDLDLVGINTYGALPSLREHLVKVGWTRPWIVTEYGPQGFWESPRTAWEAPREQNSTQKAAMIRRNYAKTIAPGGLCLGSYAFVWGQKQEATATWFGLFTADGMSTETVDVLQELWTGHAPKNSAPKMRELKSDRPSLVLNPGDTFQLTAAAEDPDGDPLSVRWEVHDDARRRDAQGREKPTSALPGIVDADQFKATITAPKKPGLYRAYLFVLDGKGHAATANIPFKVGP